MTTNPRIILYSGKGGVGKTTVAAASGLRCSNLGYRTLVMSLDVAHSLADSFDLNVHLQDKHMGEAIHIKDNLWIQEIDVQAEIERYWGDVYKYLALLLNTTGIDKVVAEELAIIPGMEEVICLLYLNDYLMNSTYDVLILDCAPTGESLRFISMPSTLEWYMKKLFKLERNLMKAARPLAKTFTDIPLPEDSYFRALESLFKRLQGVDKVLLDNEITSVRLVTNAEKMVIKETQRAFMYFCLYGMAVDLVVINRLLPTEAGDGYFRKWLATQGRHIESIEDYFAPVPAIKLPLLEDEAVGLDKLETVAELLYEGRDPRKVFFAERPFEYTKEGNYGYLRLKLPFLSKEHLDLYRGNDELIVRVGSFKRHIPIPRAFLSLQIKGAKIEGDKLWVTFQEEAK